MTSDGGNVGGADLELSTPVTPTAQGLNPNANEFESKLPLSPAEVNNSATWEDGNDASASPTLPLSSLNDGYPYMNGDVSKLQPTAVVFSTTAAPAAAGVPPGPMPTEYTSMADAAIVGATDGLATYTTPQTPDSGTNEESITDEPSVHENGLPHDQLKALLQHQLEYYFSRENLSVDMYLVSQMDSDQYVPIWTVANFNKIRELTKDINLIVQVLRESPNVQVDEAGEKVRPNHKRCIVILREVPETTPVEEVESLFQGDNCPRFVSCEFAHNNSWYVTFESDEDAQRAYRYLREEVKNFQGKPIMARIKAKPLPRAPLVPKNGMRPSHLDPNLFPQSPQQPPATPRYTTAYQANAAAASTMPNMGGYNGQQLHVYVPFPPFYPPSMLQTWPPTSPAYLDISSVFSINGLAPQSAYKPPTSGGRHSFQSIRNRNQKSHGRVGGQDNMDRLDTRPSQYDLQQRGNGSGLQHGAVSPAAVVNGNGTSNDVQECHAGHGVGVAAASDISHSRRESGQTTPINTIATPVIPVATVEKEETTTQTMASTVYRQLEAQTLQTSQPQRNRNRRRKREDDLAFTKNNRPETAAGKTQPASLKETPKFDFEAASFPPLPGMGSSADGSCAENDALENRMSDVVKGTAKPSTVDSKTQTFAPLSPGIRDNTVLINGGDESLLAAATAVPTPPPSPVPVVTRVSKGVTTADKATRTDDSLMKGAEMNSFSHQKQQASSATITAFTMTPKPSMPSPKATSAGSGTPKTPTTPVSKAAPNVTTSNANTVTVAASATASSPSPAYSPGSNTKESASKLSYAQIAQRGRERSEKMALEQKDTTEKDQRRKSDQSQSSNFSNSFSGANKHNSVAARQQQQQQQPQQQPQQQQVPSKDGRHPRDYPRNNNNGSREKYNSYPTTDQPRDNRFRRPRSQKENEFREDNRRREGGWPKFSK